MKINTAIKMAGGQDGYIDYNETWEYSHAMYNFIEESKNLLAKKEYDLAFDIVEIILTSILETDIDDSYGIAWDIADDEYKINHYQTLLKSMNK